jgi:Rrf2 family protein
MRITAKVDYAVRASTELARRWIDAGGRAPMKGEAIATSQEIPVRFLESILAELRRAGIVGSQRGAEGGYWLARPPTEVSVADLIRAVEGPLADVHGTPPEELDYTGPASSLQTVWIATRAALRSVLEATTLADIVAGELPDHLRDLAGAPDAWSRR